MIQLLYVLVLLNNQPCKIPTTIAYNDTLMYVSYSSVVEEYKIKKITKERNGNIYITLDNDGLCFINPYTTYISVNKGKHEMILRPVEPTYFHNLLKPPRKTKQTLIVHNASSVNAVRLM